VRDKKISTHKDIAVIMLSSAFEQAELCRKLGSKGFIKKSDDVTTFRKELHRVINMGITVNYITIDEVKSPYKNRL
jgi:hypothetical protein